MSRRQAGRRPVLLTVSGVIDERDRAAVRAGRRARLDYDELAKACDADLLDVAAARRAAGWWGRIVERACGAAVLLALVTFIRRRTYEVVFTDGEHVGLPYAALTRIFGRGATRHVMIAHILSVPKKVWPFRLLALGGRIDQFIVYASAQRTFVIERLGMPAERVTLTPFMVDTRFFAPGPARRPTDRMVCSAGLERRDYATLMAAAWELPDVEFVVAAASSWARPRESSEDVKIPPNVTLCRLDHYELRDLYDRAAAVVMPLLDTDFQAGITTILEAMAMAKPVICTRTRGQTDAVVDGVNGIYVPPGDPSALRSAVVTVLDDPALAARLGEQGRRDAVAHADIDVYTASLARVVHSELEPLRSGVAPVQAHLH
jgi:glycosyltransferase involved in cell wall biosynthesis